MSSICTQHGFYGCTAAKYVAVVNHSSDNELKFLSANVTIYREMIEECRELMNAYHNHKWCKDCIEWNGWMESCSLFGGWMAHIHRMLLTTREFPHLRQMRQCMYDVILVLLFISSKWSPVPRMSKHKHSTEIQLSHLWIANGVYLKMNSIC